MQEDRRPDRGGPALIGTHPQAAGAVAEQGQDRIVGQAARVRRVMNPAGPDARSSVQAVEAAAQLPTQSRPSASGRMELTKLLLRLLESAGSVLYEPNFSRAGSKMLTRRQRAHPETSGAIHQELLHDVVAKAGRITGNVPVVPECAGGRLEQVEPAFSVPIQRPPPGAGARAVSWSLPRLAGAATLWRQTVNPSSSQRLRPPPAVLTHRRPSPSSVIAR